MRLFGHHHRRRDCLRDAGPPWAIDLNAKLDRVLINQESIMIDTSKILAAVAREKTESASLRALLAAKDQIIADGAAKLQAAIAAGGDPAVIAQVQADLDQAANDLNTDSAAADAITANLTPAPAAPPAAT